MTDEILKEIAAERKRQDQKWGGAAHDDNYDLRDFIRWGKNYLSWSDQMADALSWAKARRRMVQVAALAVAAVEWIDRNKHSQLDEKAPDHN